MSRQDYLDEVKSQLQSEEFYLKLDEELMLRYAKKLCVSSQKWRTAKLLIKKTKYLLPLDPHTSRFYILSNIHKEGNLGRPILSSCGAPIERISQCVDHQLRPLVIKSSLHISKTLQTFYQNFSSSEFHRETCCSLWRSAPFTQISHIKKESWPAGSC